jgi:hypothetical protein
MCKTVSTSFFLIHILRKHNSCTVSEVIKKKEFVEDSIPAVFIDVSFRSLLNSFECYPEIFDFKDDTITRHKNSSSFFEEPLIHYFNQNLDKSTTDKIIQLL